MNSTAFDAYESNGLVTVCATVFADELERSVTVVLNSQEQSAEGM